MTATWNGTPKTWVDDELIDAETFNVEIRDRFDCVKELPSENYLCDEVANYTSMTTTWVDIDSTKLSFTITSYGGDILIGFYGNIHSNDSVNNLCHFDVTCDETRLGDDDGLVSYNRSTNLVHTIISFTYLLSELSPGEHTFALQWKGLNDAKTRTLYAGAGTADFDTHPQFWVKEI